MIGPILVLLVAGLFILAVPVAVVLVYRRVKWLGLVLLLYVSAGFAFHQLWWNAREACDREMAARNDFVEKSPFSYPVMLVANFICWPLYAWVNVSNQGTLFATPCTHSRPGSGGHGPEGSS